MPDLFDEPVKAPAAPEPPVDQAPSATAPSEDTGGSSPEQVGVTLADEYKADAPVTVGFAGYEVTLTTSVTKVDKDKAERLVESPVVVYA